MKRLAAVLLLAFLASGCVHRWVGRPVAQLEKEYGSPRNIRREGDNRIYYYPDLLAGRGEMTFTVDRRGIIRAWCATANVPSVFQDDVLDNPLDPGFGNSTNGGLSPTGPNGGVGSRVRNLP